MKCTENLIKILPSNHHLIVHLSHLPSPNHHPTYFTFLPQTTNPTYLIFHLPIQKRNVMGLVIGVPYWLTNQFDSIENERPISWHQIKMFTEFKNGEKCAHVVSWSFFESSECNAECIHGQCIWRRNLLQQRRYQTWVHALCAHKRNKKKTNNKSITN